MSTDLKRSLAVDAAAAAVSPWRASWQGGAPLGVGDRPDAAALGWIPAALGRVTAAAGPGRVEEAGSGTHGGAKRGHRRCFSTSCSAASITSFGVSTHWMRIPVATRRSSWAKTLRGFAEATIRVSPLTAIGRTM